MSPSADARTLNNRASRMGRATVSVAVSRNPRPALAIVAMNPLSLSHWDLSVCRCANQRRPTRSPSPRLRLSLRGLARTAGTPSLLLADHYRATPP